MEKLDEHCEDLQLQVNMYDPYGATVDDMTKDLSHLDFYPE